MKENENNQINIFKEMDNGVMIWHYGGMGSSNQMT